jgi:hypothetical protein
MRIDHAFSALNNRFDLSIKINSTACKEFDWSNRSDDNNIWFCCFWRSFSLSDMFFAHLIKKSAFSLNISNRYEMMNWKSIQKLIYSVDDSIAWLTWSISDFYDQLIFWLKHRIRWITILIFIVRNNVWSSIILCFIFHNCIRSKRDFLKRMLKNEIHHSSSSETRFLRIRSLKNHSLCKFVFLSRNASKSMFRLLFFLTIQTRVCRFYFM